MDPASYGSWKLFTANQYSKNIKIKHSDNGGELFVQRFQKFLAKRRNKARGNGLQTPEQNSAAERKNLTLVEVVRCMLEDSKHPKSYFTDTLSTVNCID